MGARAGCPGLPRNSGKVECALHPHPRECFGEPRVEPVAPLAAVNALLAPAPLLISVAGGALYRELLHVTSKLDGWSWSMRPVSTL